MKKKLIIALTLVLLAAFAIPTAFALTDQQSKEIESLYTQMHELRKQVIDKYVKSGDITAEDAKLIKDRMDQGFEYKKSQGFENFGPGMGGGRGGRGCGGFGRGFGGGAGFGPGGGAGTFAPSNI